VQWHSRHQVELPVARQGVGQQSAQWMGQAAHAAVFEKVDQLAQRAFIRAVTEDFVEA
jgi:hypothetical protein